MAPSGDLELRITNGGSRWKLHGSAAVEVWRGRQYVGTMSGAALCLLVEHHLATAALQAAITVELATPPPPLLPAPAEQPRKPPDPVRPRGGMISREQKAELRRLRRMPKNRGMSG